jgi:RNA polymerase sigma-70 factor (ECF subfamily)
MSERYAEIDTIEAALSGERPRLVRLCTRLSGDANAAEDLAQETLVEAWRALDALRDPDGLAPWLSAIAHNVCRRWMRRRGRDIAHRALGEAGETARIEAVPDEGDDVSLILERDELATLLDRALALLPAETRQVLIESYIHEVPQAQLAARLGLSDGAVRVRLHRGKLALRRLLTTDLRDEAVMLGVVTPDTPSWHETRIRCPFCGRHPLRYIVDHQTGEFTYRCPGGCISTGIVAGAVRCVTPHGELLSATSMLNELTSAKSILMRLLPMLDARYRRALASGFAPCIRCGRRTPLRRWPSDDVPDYVPATHHFMYGIDLNCPACGSGDVASLAHLALDLPETQRFWRRHSRMRALPIQEIEVAGRPALLTGFHSPQDQARLEVIMARDTYEVLRPDGEPHSSLEERA